MPVSQVLQCVAVRCSVLQCVAVCIQHTQKHTIFERERGNIFFIVFYYTCLRTLQAHVYVLYRHMYIYLCIYI